MLIYIATKVLGYSSDLIVEDMGRVDYNEPLMKIIPLDIGIEKSLFIIVLITFDNLPDELRKHIFSYLRNRARDCCAM